MIMIVVVLRTKPSGLYRHRRGLGLDRVGYREGDLHICNAPNSMRQVSASYSPSLPCHLLACCIFSCHHVHFILHSCSSHASEPFPRYPFRDPALLCHPAFPFRLSM